MQHRVTRTARARRRSGGQKRPSGAFLERGRVPDGAPYQANPNVLLFEEAFGFVFYLDLV